MAKRVEIFRTNIQDKIQSEVIKTELLSIFPKLKIDFDLEDVDRILRIEGFSFCPNEIILILVSKNYNCEIMI